MSKACGICVVALGLCAPVGLALADTEISIDVVTPADGPPRLEATVLGGAPFAPPSSISIRDSRDPDAPLITPTAVKRFEDGPQRVAIAIVLLGEEIWIGNDAYEPDDEARYMGALGGIEAGLDQLDLAKLGPTGSEITVVTYAVGARVRVPWKALSELRGQMLGTQADYRSAIGTDMVSGITLGLAQLAKSDAPIKELIVIGDGNDTNNDVAKGQLADLKRQALMANIHTDAIVYKSAVSADTNVIPAMIPRAVTVNSADGIPAQIGDVLRRLSARYYVTFVDDRLPWDGRDHDLMLRIAGTDADPVSVGMPGHRHSACWHASWWQQLGIGAALLALLVVVRWRLTAAAIRRTHAV